MPQLPKDPLQLLQQAELVHDADMVRRSIDSVADALNQDFHNKTPLMVAVMTGACFFLGQLLPRLRFPLEVDYVHATRYHGSVVGKKIDWLVRPKYATGRDIVIVDDILDEGITLKAIVEKYQQLGAASVKTVVLADKLLQIEKPICADYFALQVPDSYVFGCGMDVYGWWRNLPGIYALKK
jgi:hypoxanthine phosphoribosyltransferase